MTDTSDEPGRLDRQLEALDRKLELIRSGVVGGLQDGAPLPPVGVIGDLIRRDLPPGLISRAAKDSLPIPDVDNREGYEPGDHELYWLKGLKDYDKVVNAADEFSVTGSRVYDFGGSTGRVFRHFYCQDRRFEVWSSDFKVASHLWNQQNMPAGIRVFLNTFIPSLPLPDRYFDIITAFSIFTHIDELESPWLLELRRILRPGGLLYVTIHDEVFWENLTPWLLERLQRSRGGDDLTTRSPFPGPRSAFHFTTESYYSCNVFQSRDYIAAQWGRYFEILDFKPQHSGSQCVVLLTYTG
jgi:SAM-dependent methyltransferase